MISFRKYYKIKSKLLVCMSGIGNQAYTFEAPIPTETIIGKDTEEHSKNLLKEATNTEQLKEELANLRKLAWEKWNNRADKAIEYTQTHYKANR